MHESSQTDKDRGAKKTPDLIRNALTNKLEKKKNIVGAVLFLDPPPPFEKEQLSILIILFQVIR